MQILIVKLSSLGDLFHALPAVHNLKVGLDATVDWVVQSEYADLVRCFSDVDRVIALDRSALVDNWVPFRDALREREYDLIVDLQGLLKSALTARFARGCKRIGPSFHREGSRLLYHAVAGRCNKLGRLDGLCWARQGKGELSREKKHPTSGVPLGRTERPLN